MPITGQSVLGGQRARQDAHPALEEALDVALAQSITNLLEELGVVHGQEPVVQLQVAHGTVDS